MSSIDCHCHLSFLSMEEVERIIQSTDKNKKWLMGGYQPSEWEQQVALKKKFPDKAKSEVVKPVTFWITNNTPHEFREVVKAGVLEWNKAFAKIGLLNAIECRIQPDDATWTVGDFRYNVIQWITSNDPQFAGHGPSKANPLTGDPLADGSSAAPTIAPRRPPPPPQRPWNNNKDKDKDKEKDKEKDDRRRLLEVVVPDFETEIAAVLESCTTPKCVHELNEEYTLVINKMMV